MALNFFYFCTKVFSVFADKWFVSDDNGVIEKLTNKKEVVMKNQSKVNYSNNGQLSQAELIAIAVQNALAATQTMQTQPIQQPVTQNKRVKSQSTAPSHLPPPDGYNHQGKPTWVKPTAHTAYNPNGQSGHGRFERLNETWYYSIDLNNGTVSINSNGQGVGPFRSHSAAQDAMIVLASNILRNARGWRKTDVE